MEEHAEDSGVYPIVGESWPSWWFVESHRSGGGLTWMAGFDQILAETVGVGQSELSVMEVADSVVVVLTPESGDTVQTMKAGLLK